MASWRAKSSNLFLVMLRTASILILLGSAVASHADEPFDVSLASSADLGPHYRAVIRRAIERYRGDLPSQATVGRSQAISAAGFEIGEVTDYRRGTTYLYLRSTSATGAGMIIAEAQFDDDPFPAELISLSSPPPTTASNQAMQLTAGSLAISF